MAQPNWILDLNHISPWWAILVSVIGSWSAYHFALLAAKKQARSLHLDESRATPNIGSRATVDYTGDNSWHKWAVKVTLYNDGDLVATTLEGKWIVTYNGREYTRIIRADGLPRFLPIHVKHDLLPAGNPTGPIRVDIDFSYLGMNKAIQRYKRTYESGDDPKELIQAEYSQQANGGGAQE